MLYIVMRSPCIPEDEGRHFFCGMFESREEATGWIKKQEDEYFGPSDYYIAEKT